MHVLIIFILIVGLVLCRKSHYKEFEGFDTMVGETGSTGATGTFTHSKSKWILTKKNREIDKTINSPLFDEIDDIDTVFGATIGATATSVGATSILGATSSVGATSMLGATATTAITTTSIIGATSMIGATAIAEPIGYMPPTMQSLFAGQW